MKMTNAQYLDFSPAIEAASYTCTRQWVEASRLHGDLMSALSVHTQSLMDSIRAGDRVTILVPAGIGRNGQEWTARVGRAVMRGPAGWVLNMGGRHGMPAVATLDTLVRVQKGRS